MRPGDGTPLQPLRWWQVLTRSLFSAELVTAVGAPVRYTVEVRQAGDRDDGVVRARLYRDGRLESVSRVPARFPVHDGHIEVEVGTYGMRRCHVVSSAGTARQLVPHPRSLEGRRARLHHRHPGVSRAIGVVSVTLVLVGVAVALPQLVETLLHIPPVEDAIGRFDLPYELPTSVDVAAVVLAAAGSTERALRLRSSWLDDLAG